MITLLTVRSVIVVFLAYSIGYGLICALPDVGIGLLGINAADPEFVANFQRDARIPESYAEALVRFATFNFGLTLDRQSVVAEISRGVRFSYPLFIMSTGVVVFGAAVGILSGGKKKTHLDWWLTLGAFFPAYVPAFVVAGLAPGASSWIESQPLIASIVTSAIVGVVPAMLAANLCRASLNCIATEPYALLLEVHGYGKLMKLRLLAPTVLTQVLPSLARITISVIVIQIFVEATFGWPGTGTSLIHAMKRSDVNLLLAYMALFSVITVAISVFFKLGMYVIRAGRGQL